MLSVRRHVRPASSGWSSEYQPDSRFPRAVAGEEFDRYARAMWVQAQRWLRLNWHRVAGRDLAMHDGREILRSAAAIDLGRGLHPQEETLLSEVLHKAWSDPEWHGMNVMPEIPSFLQPSSPIRRPPAA